MVGLVASCGERLCIVIEGYFVVPCKRAGAEHTVVSTLDTRVLSETRSNIDNKSARVTRDPRQI